MQVISKNEDERSGSKGANLVDSVIYREDWQIFGRKICWKI